MNRIETPPRLQGDEAAQLGQVYSYLFRLSETLNLALQVVGTETADIAEKAASAAVQQSSTAQGASYTNLRSLILNTASVIRTEMDKLETTLHSETTAISHQFGTFQENIRSTITATAESVVQRYDYDAKLQALQDEAAGFSAYKVKTEGYIRSGFIDYDAQGVPILGIAIGQELSSTTVTVNGEELQQFDPHQSCAFYTAEKVSFRIQGQEVAYVSNRKLYIGDVEITGSVIFGDWLLSTGNGIAMKWIGGA